MSKKPQRQEPVSPEEDDEFGEDNLNTQLDEMTRSELDEMIGTKVVGLEVWEESLGDEGEEEPITPENRVFFDCDLLLENGTALELYVATAYPDPDGEPVTGMEKIFDLVGTLHDDGLQLLDYDEADEEGGLALVFGLQEKVHMIIVASAWMASEWEPADEDAES